MATNDFICDLVEKLTEEKIEYMLISVQKGDKEHKASAHFNINTIDGLDMIATTVDHVFQNLADDDSSTDIELDLSDDDFKEGAD